MTTQMNFGPEWMRGGNTNSKDTTESYKYSREYMLSLYKSSDEQPIDIQHKEYVAASESQNPLSFFNSKDKKLLSLENNLADIRRGSEDDIPLWSGVDKDNVGTFDSNGVFHIGNIATQNSLLEGALEPEHESASPPFLQNVSQTAIFSEDHQRAVSSPGSFFFNNASSLNTVHPAKVSNKPHQWTYRDPSGRVQGPFTTAEMQGWFEAGYFDHSLSIKRDDSPFFQTLSTLIRTANDSEKPFLAQQEDMGTHHRATSSGLLSPSSFNGAYSDESTLLFNKPPFEAPHNTVPESILNNFAEDRHDSFMLNSNSHLPSQSSFGNTAPFVSLLARGNTSIQTPLSPWEPPNAPGGSWLGAQGDFPGGNLARGHHQSSMQPLIDSTLDLGFSNNDLQQSAMNQQMEQQYLLMLRQNQQQHLQIQQRMLQQQQQQQQQQHDSFMGASLNYAPVNHFPVQQPSLNSAINDRGWSSVPGTPGIMEPGQSLWGSSNQFTSTRYNQDSQRAAFESSTNGSQSPPRTEMESIALAVAASAVDDQLAEKLSKVQLADEAQLPKSPEQLSSKSVQQEAPSNPTSQQPSQQSAWGSTNTQKKTLREIQIEEESNSSKRSHQRPSTWSSIAPRAPVTVTPSYSTNTNAGRSTKQSQWDKPAVRQKHLSMTASIPPPRPAPRAQKPSGPIIKSEPKGPSQDFIQWCKLSLKNLNPGVNGDEILQMLLSFPVDNSCSEIIQDIIYANSSSMDGRRFASDFITRRKADMEGKKLNVVLPKSDNVSEFKVVTKKNKKKYQHQ